MGIIAELVRRGLVVLLVVLVTMRVVCGELSTMVETRPPSPARPKGYELRTVRKIGPKVLALRLQVILA